MEGNREHVDTLITMLTEKGFDVYPMTATGRERERMLHELMPDGVVYMPMGRIGNDTLVQWMHDQNIVLFSPFPLSVTHQEWMTDSIPMTAGSKNARIVIPEIDGAVAPCCIGTQNANADGYLMRKAEVERCRVSSAMRLPSSHACSSGVLSGFMLYMFRPVGSTLSFITGSPPGAGAMAAPLSAATILSISAFVDVSSSWRRRGQSAESLLMALTVASSCSSVYGCPKM